MARPQLVPTPEFLYPVDISSPDGRIQRERSHLYSPDGVSDTSGGYLRVSVGAERALVEYVATVSTERGSKPRVVQTYAVRPR